MLLFLTSFVWAQPAPPAPAPVRVKDRPPPGYTVAPGPFGGYWMKRIEDLYAKDKRPFYAE